MEKEKKIGMSKLDWTLSIIGIIVLASFIILPPVFRNFLTEEDTYTPDVPVANHTPAPGSGTSRQITCTKQDTDIETESIFYGKDTDIVEVFAQTETQHYEEITEEVQNMCSNMPVLYQNIKGFYYTCEVKDNDVVISSRINFQEYDGADVPLLVVPNQTVASLRSSLENNGYSCKD